MTKRLFAIAILIVLGIQIFPQSSLSEIRIICRQPIPSELKLRKGDRYLLNEVDPFENQLSFFLSHLYAIGYLESAIDSVIQSDDETLAFLSLGRQFHWLDLEVPDIEYGVEFKIPAKLQTSRFAVLSISKYQALQEFLIQEYENQGFPFVSVGLDSIQILDSIVQARLTINPGRRIILDSLLVRSEIPISDKILKRISGLDLGEWYSEKNLIAAQKRLHKSGFMSEQQALELGFFEDKAWVYLSPEIRKKNRIDGLIGILPSSGSNLPAIAGEFNLLLNNLVKQAESLTIQWKASGAGTQKLFTDLAFPYVFGWPVGISGQLDLYKRDSSYLNFAASGGLRIAFQPGQWLDVLFEKRSSSGLASSLGNSFQDFYLNLSKLVLNIDNRNSTLNASSGWFIGQKLAYGRKKMGEDENLEEGSNYWEAETEASLFLPFGQNWTTALEINGGYRSGYLSSNEQYRLGGFSMLRGFQEESLFCSSYAIATAEIRLLLSALSNIHVFFDYGILNSPSLSPTVEPVVYPYAPGIGLSLQTKAGIFRIDYALGQITGQVFSLQNGLIHLGIQSIF